ncbi:sulfite reductase subunit alpha [Pseudoxanthomonas indica]|uniref:NADPH--hemoprotein reductase n=1 Tax=Pseudoxanthomonas indica TaxID=428993 RepID=A0A1T5M237_9GAMM|nr:sulfite reductase subunit alpha [Pseudoxanthomonas indica]GGD60604.1 hypothetical protein GCM10007235_36010 [Pseudoxanthomonas indica]SKC82213.1 PepSY-associated TM region [Pseudoxanthomonas indica]
MINLRIFDTCIASPVPSVSEVAGEGARSNGKSRSFGEAFERAILLIHRWIGIFACVLFVTWFISGVILAYVRWPAMDRTERVNVLKPIEWSSVGASPTAALQALQLQDFPKDFRLEMSGGKPVYRAIGWDKRERVATEAQTGTAAIEQPPVSGEAGLAIVREQLSAPAATLETADLERDQWTVTGYFNKHRPFHLVSLNDEAGSKYYVSVATGEIVLDTKRKERFWNWLGAIPHWIYFPIIRKHEGKWTWMIYGLSAAGIFVAISGVWIGIKRVRLSRRYSNGKRVPFSGWLRWHHILGLIGGFFLCMWVISGLLTMYPGGFLEGRSLTKTDFERFRGVSAPRFPRVDFNALGSVAGDARRITFNYMAGVPILVLEYPGASSRVLDARSLKPITYQSPLYRQATEALVPEAKLLSMSWIQDGDEYWHTGFASKKLPVVRAIFDDQVWFHIDPEAGAVIDVMDRTARVDRWTAVGIHDLDWYWLLKKRPLWDFVLLVTIIPGLAISVTALVIGFKRLRKSVEPDLAFEPESFEDSGAEESGANLVHTSTARKAMVVFSSQTGTAEELAEQLRTGLVHARMEVQKRDLAELSPDDIAQCELALFVISTTGEGEPPDKAMAFVRRHMKQPANLVATAYAVIALGDSEYPKYCQFGRQVDAWLMQSKARRLFRTALVDKGEDAAIKTWVQNLEASLERTIHVERNELFSRWNLIDRTCINEGSAGEPILRINLASPEAGHHWLPGDIARLQAGITWDEYALGQRSIVRDYSIASVETEGCISLLVRLARKPDGSIGTGSGWLANAPIGTSMVLRIRSNPGFHPAPGGSPAIFIGNGTGYAGLRAHLMERVAHGSGRNWLVFGERNRTTDFVCSEDIKAFSDAGRLEACDLVFSRDQPVRRYVQDALRERSDNIRHWVEQGAYIFVCGSQQGMAPGVHSALQRALGEEFLQELAETGRYRRDVY